VPWGCPVGTYSVPYHVGISTRLGMREHGPPDLTTFSPVPHTATDIDRAIRSTARLGEALFSNLLGSKPKVANRSKSPIDRTAAVHVNGTGRDHYGDA
jgi:hypothetical protein